VPLLTIEEIVRRTDQGLCKPYLCRAEDGALYFLKGRNANLKGLLAEWFAAHLGAALGLPIPEFVLVHVPEELAVACPFSSAIRDLVDIPVFASRKVMGTQEFRYSLVDQVPAELRRNLLAFDWWVQNSDRTLSDKGGNPNLLWDSAGRRLTVIDHNMAFEGGFKPRDFLDLHPFCRDAPAVFGDCVMRVEFEDRFDSAMKTAWIAAENAWLDACPDEEKEASEQWIDSLRTVVERFRQPGFWEAST
jgi:hypothetical protein